MNIDRRDFLITVSGAMVAGGVARPAHVELAEQREMYGLIGKMNAIPGERDALIAILIEGVAAMPGCLSYIVARDSGDENALWVTEVWESQALHDASLALPSVKRAIGLGRPLIAGFGERFLTTPVGGHGLTPVAAGTSK